MTTETPTTPAPGTTPASTTTPSTPATAPDPAAKTTPDPAAKPADAPKEGDPKPGDLMFGKKPEEKKADAPADKPAEKPAIADQRKALLEKATDEAAKKALEGKTDEEIAKLFDEADAKAKADEEAAKNPPFKFEDLKIPADMPVTPEMKEKVSELSNIFNDEKLSKTEKMQKAIDLHLEQQQKSLDFWNDTKAQWREVSKNDKVIGGQNIEKSVATAESVAVKFGGNPEFGGSPELLREFQDDLMLLGLGNKRSFIRIFNNIAKATGEDKMDGQGGNQQQQAGDMARRMWPDMPGDKKA